MSHTPEVDAESAAALLQQRSGPTTALNSLSTLVGAQEAAEGLHHSLQQPLDLGKAQPALDLGQRQSPLDLGQRQSPLDLGQRQRPLDLGQPALDLGQRQSHQIDLGQHQPALDMASLDLGQAPPLHQLSHFGNSRAMMLREAGVPIMVKSEMVEHQLGAAVATNRHDQGESLVVQQVSSGAVMPSALSPTANHHHRLHTTPSSLSSHYHSSHPNSSGESLLQQHDVSQILHHHHHHRSAAAAAGRGVLPPTSSPSSTSSSMGSLTQNGTAMSHFLGHQHLQQHTPSSQNVGGHQLLQHHHHHHHQPQHHHEFSSGGTANGLHHHLPFNGLGSSAVGGGMDCLTTQKAVAFLAGPRERIHVLGNPVEHCPRCQQEGQGSTGWRPHRHIGELKIRYICERHFDDLESNHHLDIPLCPICNQVLYLYDFNNMLGVSNARRLHKFVLKCANRHVLPLLDLFCQTKKSGERCNANFKLQWCYGTMVKRCESQKNRDHDLWWVRYKNEWKQRRTIIRYKKDFLSHLTDAQRSLLLGLGLEGEPPPDPKSVLGPTFDALVSSAVGSPGGPKIKKRGVVERGGSLGHLSLDSYDLNPAKRRLRVEDFGLVGDYVGCGTSAGGGRLGSGTGRIADPFGSLIRPSDGGLGDSVAAAVLQARRMSSAAAVKDASCASDSICDSRLTPHHQHTMMGAVVLPTSRNGPSSADEMIFVQQTANHNIGGGTFSEGGPFSDMASLLGIPPHLIASGTPTPPLLPNVNGASPVAVAVVGTALSGA